MKDKFYYILKNCLAWRKDYVNQMEIYFRFRDIREKAEKKLIYSNFIIFIFVKIINLPSDILKFIYKISQSYEYNKRLQEIAVIEKEMEKYNHLKITKGDIDD